MKKSLSLAFLVSALAFTLASGVASAEECYKIVGATATELTEVGILPEHTFDGDLISAWAVNGVEDNWIVWELEKEETLNGISLALGKGDERQAKFDIMVSSDGKNFKTAIKDGLSAGETLDYEYFPFAANVQAKYIKYVNFGNTVNLWSNITEVKFPKERPVDEKAIAAGGVQIVSKLDYVCENSMVLKSEGNAALFKAQKSSITAPVIVDGTFMVPVRSVVDMMEGKILWDEVTRSTACVLQENVLKFSDGSENVEVNGKNVKMNTPAKIIDGVFMVPLREIANNTGKTVAWYGGLNIVTMSDMVLPELSKWELLELNDRLENY